jgi:hypothetical protein
MLQYLDFPIPASFGSARNLTRLRLLRLRALSTAVFVCYYIVVHKRYRLV